MDTAMFAGFRIVTSPHAVEIKVTYEVVRASTRKKKRKNWRVERVETAKPAIFVINSQDCVMHPELFAKVKNLAL